MIVSGLLAFLMIAAPAQQEPATQTPTQAPAQTPAQPSAQAAPESKPPERKQASAKSQDEYNAYRAVTTQPDLLSAERLATDFSSRYPQSELREAMYQTLMLKQQSANRADAALANAEKVLLLNPDNVVALVVAANVLSERTLPTAADAADRFERGIRYADRALQDIETSGVAAPESAAPADVAAYRATLTAVAHAAEGNIELLRKNYMEAEKHLQQAIASAPQPDALALFRLALAQHGLKRLDDALANVNKAMAVAGSARDLLLEERIKQERTTLIKAGAKS
jgi:tetratricopeptide (TPR) repeat protein